jgi:hypothetical protein
VHWVETIKAGGMVPSALTAGRAGEMVIAGLTMIPPFIGFVMQFTRLATALAGFVVALARPVSALVSVVPLAAAVVRDLAMHASRVPVADFVRIAGLSDGSEANQSKN